MNFFVYSSEAYAFCFAFFLQYDRYSNCYYCGLTIVILTPNEAVKHEHSYK